MTVGVYTVFTFQRLMFVNNITTRLAMTVRICTVFILSKTYSISVCQQDFYKTCPDCWGLHCIHPFKDLFKICLSATFPQDLPWLLGSAMSHSFKDLFTLNDSERLNVLLNVQTRKTAKYLVKAYCLRRSHIYSTRWFDYILLSPFVYLFHSRTCVYLLHELFKSDL